jgi:hypothetical protein
MMFAYIITCDYQGSQASRPVEAFPIRTLTKESNSRAFRGPHIGAQAKRDFTTPTQPIQLPGKICVKCANYTCPSTGALCLTDRREHGLEFLYTTRPVFSSVREART